ncbi:stalk domain-containing protein [Paenibacillus sp. 32O-W]|uniref:stalk domain-containing protein n=1 Tax=Paenibacillus sp. 32O-W TaxID=1695218 RepID=UPI0011AA7E97|nr:stalk domain-containing protein [Paenibacillus sp. 32O-W]
MKKTIKGLVYGLTIGLTVGLFSTAYASDTIQAFLFPSKIIINGKEAVIDNEYNIINYNGHAYLPIRYIGEYIGGTVDFIENSNTITLNYLPYGSKFLTDSTSPSFHVGNIHIEQDGSKSVVTGLMFIDDDASNRAHSISFSLKFLDSTGKELGTYIHPLVDLNKGEITYFEGSLDADVSSFSDVILDTGIFDRVKLPHNM